MSFHWVGKLPGDAACGQESISPLVERRVRHSGLGSAAAEGVRECACSQDHRIREESRCHRHRHTVAATATAIMTEKSSPSKTADNGEFRKWLWDPDRKAFMGRTGTNWSK